MHPNSIHHMPHGFTEPFGKGGETRVLSRLAGSRRLNVNLDTVPPGAHSTRYHAHTVQEEFFLILAGSGTLRTPDGETPVEQGDFMAKLPGLETPHTFCNTGSGPLLILDIATADSGDAAYYPDDGVLLMRDIGLALDAGAVRTGWSSEPDD